MAAEITFGRSGAARDLDNLHVMTCEANSARCQGEQDGWGTNHSSKEVSQRPHSFYRHAQTLPGFASCSNALNY